MNINISTVTQHNSKVIDTDTKKILGYINYFNDGLGYEFVQMNVENPILNDHNFNGICRKVQDYFKKETKMPLIQEIKTTKFFYNGVEYDTRKEAEEAAKKKAKRREEVYTTYSYGKLKEKKLLNRVGGWKIEDEGPVDFGSSAGRMFLGVFEGTLEDAIDYAVNLPHFFGYGPGNIEPVDIGRKK